MPFFVTDGKEYLGLLGARHANVLQDSRCSLPPEEIWGARWGSVQAECERKCAIAECASRCGPLFSLPPRRGDRYCPRGHNRYFLGRARANIFSRSQTRSNATCTNISKRSSVTTSEWPWKSWLPGKYRCICKMYKMMCKKSMLYLCQVQEFNLKIKIS